MQTTTPGTGSAKTLAANSDPAAALSLSDGHAQPTALALIPEPPLPDTPLTGAEKRERNRCEAIISRGWDTFLEVGHALATIRNKRLYRDRHATFEDYCRQKWEFSKSHANRLIEASVVASILTPIGVKPKSESQVRPLVNLPPQRIPEAWKRAQELAGGKEITAKVVREAAVEFLPEAALAAEATPKNMRPQDKLAHLLKLIAKAEKAAKADDINGVSTILNRLRKRLTS